jgi:hypothetical protein
VLLRILFTTVAADVLSPSPLVKSRNRISPPEPPQEARNVLQVVETEIFNGSDWIGAKNRWSDLKGRPSNPPPSIEPPQGYQFEGDWKIVTSSNRDSLGWEYVWSEKKTARRRRLWLRTIMEHLPPTCSEPTSLLASLSDNWNFKGFGISVYKSLLSARSIGIALRLPILSNFDWWERHPALPSLSTTITGYFPWALIFGVSGSLNVDFIAWALGRSFRYALVGLSAAMLALCRLLFLPISVLLFPVYRRLVLPSFPLPPVPTIPPVYSLSIQQRIGMTISWRISQERGYEFRLSYWFTYLPTILYFLEIISRNKQATETRLTNWLRRKTGSIGIDTGGPTPVQPHYFLSAALSLSGFYFRKLPSLTTTASQSTSGSASIRPELVSDADSEEENETSPATLDIPKASTVAG